MKEIDVYWVDAFTNRTFGGNPVRGGELRCEYLGDRVLIGGQAKTYMQGKIFLPD